MDRASSFNAVTQQTKDMLKRQRIRSQQGKRKSSNTRVHLNKDPSSSEHRISEWLQSHSLWFNDEIGDKLRSVLLENGITEPESEMSLLTEWPDLV